MAISKLAPRYFLGAAISNVKVLSTKVDEIIDEVNDLIDGTITATDLTLTGDLTVGDDATITGDLVAGTITTAGASALNGAITQSLTTDATTKDTGAIITEGGIGVEKAVFAGGKITTSDTTVSTSSTTGSLIAGGGAGIAGAMFAGTTVNAGTAITVGTDITGAKEVDHIVTVATTTTAATAGGKITVKGGTGATSGTGGAAELIGGAAGATAGATGGAVNITGGAEGAGLGITGAVNITTPAATGGAAGNINISPGTSSSTTIAPLTIMSKGRVWKPLSGGVATGGTATGIQVAGGLLTITGGTGNVTLPTAAQITTAIGATPAGTVVDFVVNAVGMTATNTVTLVVGSNMSVMSAPAITGGDTLTVTQDTQVVGYFRLIYDTATTCKISRIA